MYWNELVAVVDVATVAPIEPKQSDVLKFILRQHQRQQLHQIEPKQSDVLKFLTKKGLEAIVKNWT